MIRWRCRLSLPLPPFYAPFKSPPPPFSEDRQNIKISERYRITRSHPLLDLPSPPSMCFGICRPCSLATVHQKQISKSLGSETKSHISLISKFNTFAGMRHGKHIPLKRKKMAGLWQDCFRVTFKVESARHVAVVLRAVDTHCSVTTVVAASRWHVRADDHCLSRRLHSIRHARASILPPTIPSFPATTSTGRPKGLPQLTLRVLAILFYNALLSVKIDISTLV